MTHSLCRLMVTLFNIFLTLTTLIQWFANPDQITDLWNMMVAQEIV